MPTRRGGPAGAAAPRRAAPPRRCACARHAAPRRAASLHASALRSPPERAARVGEPACGPVPPAPPPGLWRPIPDSPGAPPHAPCWRLLAPSAVMRRAPPAAPPAACLIPQGPRPALVRLVPRPTPGPIGVPPKPGQTPLPEPPALPPATPNPSKTKQPKMGGGDQAAAGCTPPPLWAAARRRRGPMPGQLSQDATAPVYDAAPSPAGAAAGAGGVPVLGGVRRLSASSGARGRGSADSRVARRGGVSGGGRLHARPAPAAAPPPPRASRPPPRARGFTTRAPFN
jgi:hypothetical protein